MSCNNIQIFPIVSKCNTNNTAIIKILITPVTPGLGDTYTYNLSTSSGTLVSSGNVSFNVDQSFTVSKTTPHVLTITKNGEDSCQSVLNLGIIQGNCPTSSLCDVNKIPSAYTVPTCTSDGSISYTLNNVNNLSGTFTYRWINKNTGLAVSQGTLANFQTQNIGPFVLKGNTVYVLELENNGCVTSTARGIVPLPSNCSYDCVFDGEHSCESRNEGDGEYATLELCVSSCKSGYSCVDNDCVSVTSNPEFLTLELCQESCLPDTSGYNCENYNCVPVESNAEFLTLELCEEECLPDTSGFNCENYNCVAVESNAEFPSIELCQESCIEPDVEIVEIVCGKNYSFGGGQDYPNSLSISVGISEGDIQFVFYPQRVPDRIIIKDNGGNVLHDSGYIGSLAWAYGGEFRDEIVSGFAGLVDPITNLTYPNTNIPGTDPDGYPTVSDYLTTPLFIPNQEYGNLLFNIYSPLQDTAWFLDVSCPEASGACCTPDNCYKTIESECIDAYTFFKDIECNTDPCNDKCQDPEACNYDEIGECKYLDCGGVCGGDAQIIPCTTLCRDQVTRIDCNYDYCDADPQGLINCLAVVIFSCGDEREEQCPLGAYCPGPAGECVDNVPNPGIDTWYPGLLCSDVDNCSGGCINYTCPSGQLVGDSINTFAFASSIKVDDCSTCLGYTETNETNCRCEKVPPEYCTNCGAVTPLNNPIIGPSPMFYDPSNVCSKYNATYSLDECLVTKETTYSFRGNSVATHQGEGGSFNINWGGHTINRAGDTITMCFKNTKCGTVCRDVIIIANNNSCLQTCAEESEDCSVNECCPYLYCEGFTLTCVSEDCYRDPCKELEVDILTIDYDEQSEEASISYKVNCECTGLTAVEINVTTPDLIQGPKTTINCGEPGIDALKTAVIGGVTLGENSTLITVEVKAACGLYQSFDTITTTSNGADCPKNTYNVPYQAPQYKMESLFSDWLDSFSEGECTGVGEIVGTPVPPLIENCTEVTYQVKEGEVVNCECVNKFCYGLTATGRDECDLSIVEVVNTPPKCGKPGRVEYDITSTNEPINVSWISNGQIVSNTSSVSIYPGKIYVLQVLDYIDCFDTVTVYYPEEEECTEVVDPGPGCSAACPRSVANIPCESTSAEIIDAYNGFISSFDAGNVCNTLQMSSPPTSCGQCVELQLDSSCGCHSCSQRFCIESEIAPSCEYELSQTCSNDVHTVHFTRTCLTGGCDCSGGTITSTDGVNRIIGSGGVYSLGLNNTSDPGTTYTFTPTTGDPISIVVSDELDCSCGCEYLFESFCSGIGVAVAATWNFRDISCCEGGYITGAGEVDNEGDNFIVNSPGFYTFVANNQSQSGISTIEITQEQIDECKDGSTVPNCGCGVLTENNTCACNSGSANCDFFQSCNENGSGGCTCTQPVNYSGSLNSFSL